MKMVGQQSTAYAYLMCANDQKIVCANQEVLLLFVHQQKRAANYYKQSHFVNPFTNCPLILWSMMGMFVYIVYRCLQTNCYTEHLAMSTRHPSPQYLFQILNSSCFSFVLYRPPKCCTIQPVVSPRNYFVPS